MARGVDVRVDAHRDPRPRAPRPRDAIDALELPGGLGVDRVQIGGHRRLELGAGLADPREHDVVGLEPGAARDRDLAARVGVDAGPGGVQDLQEAARRVGLQCVVNAVRVAGQRRVERAVALLDQGAAVDVEGRPFRPRDRRQVGPVARRRCCREREASHRPPPARSP